MNVELKKISQKQKVSVVFLYKLLSPKEKRHTTNKDVAIALADLTGKKPIEYISPILRKTYLRAWPELNRRST